MVTLSPLRQGKPNWTTGGKLEPTGYHELPTTFVPDIIMKLNITMDRSAEGYTNIFTLLSLMGIASLL